MFGLSERWDMDALCAFLAQPELYWEINDHLSAQPEQLNWPNYVSRHDVATWAATWDGNIIGYVQFLKRTSIGAEMTLAFRENFRGRIAKTLTLAAMAQAFEKKGLLKIWATVPCLLLFHLHSAFTAWTPGKPAVSASISASDTVLPRISTDAGPYSCRSDVGCASSPP